jgi:hypothetical protein
VAGLVGLLPRRARARDAGVPVPSPAPAGAARAHPARPGSALCRGFPAATPTPRRRPPSCSTARTPCSERSGRGGPKPPYPRTPAPAPLAGPPLGGRCRCWGRRRRPRRRSRRGSPPRARAWPRCWGRRPRARRRPRRPRRRSPPWSSSGGGGARAAAPSPAPPLRYAPPRPGRRAFVVPASRQVFSSAAARGSGRDRAGLPPRAGNPDAREISDPYSRPDSAPSRLGPRVRRAQPFPLPRSPLRRPPGAYRRWRRRPGPVGPPRPGAPGRRGAAPRPAARPASAPRPAPPPPALQQPPPPPRCHARSSLCRSASAATRSAAASGRWRCGSTRPTTRAACTTRHSAGARPAGGEDGRRACAACTARCSEPRAAAAAAAAAAMRAGCYLAAPCEPAPPPTPPRGSFFRNVDTRFEPPMCARRGLRTPARGRAARRAAEGASARSGARGPSPPRSPPNNAETCPSDLATASTAFKASRQLGAAARLFPAAAAQPTPRARRPLPPLSTPFAPRHPQARSVVVDMEEGVIHKMLKVGLGSLAV